MNLTTKQVERFFNKLAFEPNSGCWLWMGACNSGGYGQVGLFGRNWSAHRISFILHRGSIPFGLELDHLCRVRCCANPAHLEPVTRSENAWRGDTGIYAKKHTAKRTHCPQGHSYDAVNTHITPQGHRVCRQCHRDRERRRSGRLRQQQSGKRSIA